MPGVKIGDERRLPFFMVTKVATAAIRGELQSRRGQAALAVYVAIVECANDARSDHFEKSRKEIAARGMVETKPLDRYVSVLEDLELIRVERVQEGGWHRPNRWTLTDPRGGDSDDPTSNGHRDSDDPTPGDSNRPT